MRAFFIYSAKNKFYYPPPLRGGQKQFQFKLNNIKGHPQGMPLHLLFYSAGFSNESTKYLYFSYFL